MASKQLRTILSDWYSLATSKNPKASVTDFALCSWVSNHRFASAKTTDEFHALLHQRFGMIKQVIPFNDNLLLLYKECDEHLAHKNEKRLAFVRSVIQ